MRVVLSNSTEVHVIEQGSGATVILLHGGMGDAGSWLHQLRTLSARYRVIAYSRRRSSPNRNADAAGAYCIDQDIEDLLALRAVLRTGPAHLVGTSYGALVALAFALRYPHEVVSLVLAEPPLHPWALASLEGEALYRAFINQVWRPAADAFDRGLDLRAMQLLTDGIWGRPVFESLPEELVDARMRNASAMKALTQADDPFPDLDRAAVARLAIPALLVQGEQASALHRLVMSELARVMQGAMRAEISRAGHGSPGENPEAFDAAVLAFFDSLPAAARQASSSKGETPHVTPR
jgi:pimeloyl-ACP methyl ester carboxylesterase